MITSTMNRQLICFGRALVGCASRDSCSRMQRGVSVWIAEERGKVVGRLDIVDVEGPLGGDSGFFLYRHPVRAFCKDHDPLSRSPTWNSGWGVCPLQARVGEPLSHFGRRLCPHTAPDPAHPVVVDDQKPCLLALSQADLSSSPMISSCQQPRPGTVRLRWASTPCLPF
jgi:hypothetical protein